MNLTGLRPNLCNQQEHINKREALGVYEALPNITGLAQLRDIDMWTRKLLAQADKEMLDSMSLKNYFGCIVRTALGKGSDNVIKEKPASSNT